MIVDSFTHMQRPASASLRAGWRAGSDAARTALPSGLDPPDLPAPTTPRTAPGRGGSLQGLHPNSFLYSECPAMKLSSLSLCSQEPFGATRSVDSTEMGWGGGPELAAGCHEECRLHSAFGGGPKQWESPVSGTMWTRCASLIKSLYLSGSTRRWAAYEALR